MSIEQNEFITIGDYLNNFLNDASVNCFDKCASDFLTEELASSEKVCIQGCYEKYFISFSNTASIMGLNNTNKL